MNFRLRLFLILNLQLISNSFTNPAVTSKMYTMLQHQDSTGVQVAVSKADLQGGTFCSI